MQNKNVVHLELVSRKAPALNRALEFQVDGVFALAVIRSASLSVTSEQIVRDLVSKLPAIFVGGVRRSHIRESMLEAGWSNSVLSEALTELLELSVLFRSPSGKSISLVPFYDHRPGKPKPARCVYCSVWSQRPTTDHVIPLGQGGDDSDSNKVIACRRCNAAKGCRTPHQWATDILNYRRHPKPRMRLSLRSLLQLVCGKRGAK